MPARLAQTCARACRRALAGAARSEPVRGAVGGRVGQLRALLARRRCRPRGTDAPTLQVIQAGVGNAIHLVPVDDVVYFEAADKYVRVVTAGRAST